MKIFLTGGNGFIGRYLKKNLCHEIIAPSSSELNLLDTYTVIRFLQENQFDAVIHCAVCGRNNVYDIDESIAANNLQMFYNLSLGRNDYDKFINFGSGAEFGLDHDVDLAYEDSIHFINPKESYGFSKNLITRCCLKTPNFFNLRIFACFDPSESPNRFFTKFKNTVEEGKKFIIDQDRYIDFFSLEDVTIVVEEALKGNITHQDLNLVYQDKFMTSELLDKYCRLKNIDPSFIVVAGYGKNYTGDGARLASYDLALAGLTATFARY